MTIINNNQRVQLDESFQAKHETLLNFFSNNELDIEISNDFVGLKTHLTSLSKEEYPYDFDQAFDRVDKISPNSFVLYLKSGDSIVSTYSATELKLDTFYAGMRDVHTGTYENVDVDLGWSFYSSCQWVSKDHRGKKFGVCLDHLKKNIVFDVLNGDIQYAIHKEAFTDYHLNDLHYDNSVKLATIPNGDVGGAGDETDKIYNLTWATNSSWASKQDDVRKLYTSS